MHLCSRAALKIAGAAMLTGLLTPVAAEAASYTSTGQRCTIVGTAKNDVLTGTSKRDVICGRGGRDRIQGRGGDDVIDAGGGKDTVIAGPGDDVIVGGADDDTIKAGAGDDRVDGGSGDDEIEGQAGLDLLRGGAAGDEIDGGGDDDVVLGDAGDDVTDGGSGADEVGGGTGDDELSGGSGADEVDGDSGFNVCDAPNEAADTQVRCVTDTAKPVIESVVATPAAVDVSDSEQVVRIRVHVTDDTGVARVQAGTLAALVSGTRRDGVWVSTVVVPRFVAPGPRGVDVFVTDRVGRRGDNSAEQVYTVANSVVDREMPVLRSITLSRASIDVRARAQSITATVHLTDDLAGPGSVALCGSHAWPTGQPSFRSDAEPCEFMTKISGTRRDGTWAATYTIPKGAPSGRWNFAVWIDDVAGNGLVDYWYGPDEYAAHSDWVDDRFRAIPDGGGVFTVVGTPQDLEAPVLSSIRFNTPVVDTSRGAVRVVADIAGVDARGITAASLSISGYAGYPENESWGDPLSIAWVQDFQLHQGTAREGVWRASFVVPGGTPDGNYFMQVVLQDSAHFESWISPGNGWVGDDIHPLAPEQAPGGVFFVVANS